MAAVKTYQIKPGTNNNKHGSTALTSLSQFTISYDGEATSLGSDGNKFNSLNFVDNLQYTITVTGYDQSINLLPGTSGELVLEGVQVANGAGPGADTDIYTFKNAVVQPGLSKGFNHQGAGDYSITFVSVSDDGTADPLTVT